MGRESVVMQNARDHSKRICTTAHIADLNVSSVYSANKKPVSIPCAEFAFYTNHENWNGEWEWEREWEWEVRAGAATPSKKSKKKPERR